MIKKISNQLPKICLMTTVLFFFAMPAMAAEYVSVNKDGVNIRSGPSTKNKVLWEVFKGFPLKVVKRQDKWVYVEDFEGDTGWIYDSLLNSKTTVIVKVETANMRNSPSKNDKVVATVKKGVVFTPIEAQGNWLKVNYKDDLAGWMYKTLLWPEDPL